MLPDRVSNPGPLTYESGALPIALRGPACRLACSYVLAVLWTTFVTSCFPLGCRSSFEIGSTLRKNLLLGEQILSLKSRAA